MTRSKNLRGATAACIALALVGCATNTEMARDPGVELVALETLPAPIAIPAFRIGPLQSVEVVVVGVPDLTGSYLTDEQGNLSFPLVGQVPTGGMTPAEASRAIADRLRGDFVVNPQVRLQPKDLPAPSVSVGGEVKNPGAYPAVASPSLLRAVNNAGGLGEYAKVDDVLIMRTVAGQRYIGVYNIRAIQRGNYPDPAIYPSDIITVGDSPGRRRLERILQLVPAITSPILLIDQATR